jgi:hypothetical protein
MATTFGISTTELYRQPGLTISINDKNQIEGSGEYIIAKEQVNSILAKVYPGAYATTIDDNIPTWAGNLRVASHDVSIDEGGLATIKIQFLAPSGNQYDSTFPDVVQNEPTYRLEGRLSEKSLTEHPKFKDLDEGQQTALKELISGNIIYAEDAFDLGTYYLWYPRKDDGSSIKYPIALAIGDSVTFAKMIAGGITTYVFPTITWTETAEGSSSMISSEINKLGKKSTPRNSPPTPSGTRDWMLTGASQEQKGTAIGAIYQTSIEWTCSEDGGWNDFLYD